MKPSDGWLATSRYSNKQGVLDSGRMPIGITRGAPKFPLGFGFNNHQLLAPQGAIFRLQGQEFVDGYRAQLERIGIEKIHRELSGIPAPRGIVLLCYERVVEPDYELCHRRVFAEWYEEQTGIEIPELADHTKPKRKGGVQKGGRPARIFTPSLFEED